MSKLVEIHFNAFFPFFCQVIIYFFPWVKGFFPHHFLMKVIQSGIECVLNDGRYGLEWYFCRVCLILTTRGCLTGSDIEPGLQLEIAIEFEWIYLDLKFCSCICWGKWKAFRQHWNMAHSGHSGLAPGVSARTSDLPLPCLVFCLVVFLFCCLFWVSVLNDMVKWWWIILITARHLY